MISIEILITNCRPLELEEKGQVTAVILKKQMILPLAGNQGGSASVSISLTVILVIIGEFEELIELPPVVIASVDGLLLQPVAATAVVASMTTEVLPVKASILVTSAAFHFD